MKRSQGINIGIGMIVFGAGYFAYSGIRKQNLFNQIMEKIGLAAVDITTYEEWFSPQYWINYNTGAYWLVSDGKVLEWVNQLNDSFSAQGNIITNNIGWDDEQGIYSVFSQIPDGVALSQVSAKYAEKFGDLRTRINDMSQDEVQTIAGILGSKPPFRVAETA